MAYINLASTLKLARANQINTLIGAGGQMLLFTGTPPLSPDHPTTGSLLVSLPLATPAATASLVITSITIVAAGTGGASGTQTVTGTTGAGFPFQASVTVTAGGISAILGMVTSGAYTVGPVVPSHEPVTGAGLTGAIVSVVLTGLLVFGTINPANASGAGNAGYARIQTSGGIGIIDLDCGTSNASVLMNTTAIIAGAPVLCSADVLAEA